MKINARAALATHVVTVQLCWATEGQRALVQQTWDTRVVKTGHHETSVIARREACVAGRRYTLGANFNRNMFPHVGFFTGDASALLTLGHAHGTVEDGKRKNHVRKECVLHSEAESTTIYFGLKCAGRSRKLL